MSQVGVLFAQGDEKQSLEECLAEISARIEASNQSLDEIYNGIYTINDLIAENSANLEVLQVQKDQQKAAMMKRIQYMYEAGASMDVLLALLTSDSIADALNKTAYISEMVDYDREMLENYASTIRSIEDTQTELENKRAELIELKNSFEDAKYEASEALTEATERLAEYDIEAEDVQQLLEDYMGVDETISVPDLSDFEYIEETGDSGSGSYIDDESDGDDDEDVSEETGSASEDITSESQSESYDDDDEDEEEYYEDDDDDDSSSGYYVPISTYSYSEQEIYDLARVTYLEDGCVYPEGSYRSIYLCACVILNRANNWYGGSISAAIYASGAYATAYKYTNWGGGALTISDITWAAVNDALSNCDPNPYYQCNGQHLAGYGLTEYYRDPVTDEVFYYE